MQYTYRCVPAPMSVWVQGGSKPGDATKAFEEIINQNAVEGWEYVGIDDISSTEPGGCFGGKPTITTLKMIVFKRTA